MANVSMTVPTDYNAEQLSIERRRKLAEAMQAQSVQPMESQTAGGWVIPTSHWQGAAKLAQAFGAAYGQNKADESERALASKYRQDLVDTVTNAERARLGTPGSPQPSADLGGGPAQPASPANAQLANAMLLNHPATQPMGLQGMQRDMQTQAFIQAGQGGQATPATPGAPQATQVASIAPTGSVPIGQPPAAPAAPAAQPAGFGGPAGGQPMAAWLATDPSGKAYLEQLAKEHGEQNKPLIDRGYGIKVYNPVTKKYELASNPDDITTVERAKLAATQPFEPPVTLKTSSSQDIQLSRPEYAEYQKSGKLPERYAQQAQGGAPLPKNVPEQDRGAFEAVASGKVPAAYGPTPSSAATPQKSGLGTVGATQTQADAISQAGQTAANTEAGKEFISEMRQNYAKLRDVPATLENIERAKVLAQGEAAKFMGPFGESKLAVTKFMRSNLPGMGNLKTDSVTSAEELQSTLFNQVMDNLKKMDASPSQYQQQVMQEAFGTLRTDPKSVPKILDVFSDILRNRVDLHNSTVKSAESRGTSFPYDVNVKLPDRSGGLKLSPATLEFMKANGIQPPQ